MLRPRFSCERSEHTWIWHRLEVVQDTHYFAPARTFNAKADCLYQLMHVLLFILCEEWQNSTVSGCDQRVRVGGASPHTARSWYSRRRQGKPCRISHPSWDSCSWQLLFHPYLHYFFCRKDIQHLCMHRGTEGVVLSRRSSKAVEELMTST